jgi:small subunit ribosomal protein S19
MSRSVKKGPFIEARLLGRIEEMNKRNEKKVVKTSSSRPSSVTPSPSTTARSTSRST